MLTSDTLGCSQKRRGSMTPRVQLLVIGLVLLLCFGLRMSLPGTAEASNVDSATQQVERGARQVGRGVEDTARGVGNTVVEGARVTGQKLQEAGKTVQPQAEDAMHKVKDSAESAGAEVKNFFNKLFRK
jgi:hypothetical protein